MACCPGLPAAVLRRLHKPVVWLGQHATRAAATRELKSELLRRSTQREGCAFGGTDDADDAAAAVACSAMQQQQQQQQHSTMGQAGRAFMRRAHSAGQQLLDMLLAGGGNNSTCRLYTFDAADE